MYSIPIGNDNCLVQRRFFSVERSAHGVVEMLRFASRQATRHYFPALFTKCVGAWGQVRMSKASNVVIRKENTEKCHSDVQNTNTLSYNQLNITTEAWEFFETRERNFSFPDYSHSASRQLEKKRLKMIEMVQKG